MDRNPDATFGLLNHTMISKINRLLKPFRLRLKVRCNCRQWGDQVEVTVERFVPAEKTGLLATIARHRGLQRFLDLQPRPLGHGRDGDLRAGAPPKGE